MSVRNYYQCEGSFPKYNVRCDCRPFGQLCCIFCCLLFMVNLKTFITFKRFIIAVYNLGRKFCPWQVAATGVILQSMRWNYVLNCISNGVLIEGIGGKMPQERQKTSTLSLNWYDISRMAEPIEAKFCTVIRIKLFLVIFIYPANSWAVRQFSSDLPPHKPDLLVTGLFFIICG